MILRLAVAAATLTTAFAGAPIALAATVTTFSASAAAIDEVHGNGSCALGLAGSESGGVLDGKGGLTVSAGPTFGFCNGPPGTVRFDVVGGTVTASSADLSVRVTSSDSSAVNVGDTGRITADTTTNQVVGLSLGAYFGVFDRDPSLKLGFILTDTNVRIAARTNPTAIQSFDGIGTASDPFNPCAVALAGTQASFASAPPALDAAGTFLAFSGPAGSACGVGGHFEFTIPTLVTDGTSTASGTATATSGPENGTAGNWNVDETTQTVGFNLPPHFGIFTGPATNPSPALFLRAQVDVQTRTLVVESTAGAKITGGGTIAAGSFDLSANASGPKGELGFRDSSGEFRSTSITSVIVDGTHGTIRGTGTWNGDAVTFRIDVDDNGEPGRNDRYAIVLSNGHSASGTLTGGNIQVHGAPRTVSSARRAAPAKHHR
jgi:hypothetical protein